MVWLLIWVVRCAWLWSEVGVEALLGVVGRERLRRTPPATEPVGVLGRVVAGVFSAEEELRCWPICMLRIARSRLRPARAGSSGLSWRGGSV